MALSPLDQTINAITNASRIVIAPAADMGGDVIGGAYALGSALEGAGKEACVLLPEEIPSHLLFLPAPKRISSDVPFEREFTISINTNAVPIKELRYEQHEDALRLYLTAPSHFSRDHLLFEAGPHTHDLAITLGAVDLEALGPTFERHPQIFSDVSLLNIDHHAANERFGNINFVDVTASTVSEVLHQLFEKWSGETSITEEIATCLLAGIIDGTKSFQDIAVTPRTLEVAAKLLSQGAKQAEVVRHLYQSRSISHLRLWGSILGKLVLDNAHKLGYATLEENDFSSVSCTPRDLPHILEDLHAHFSHLTTIGLFFWHQNGEETTSPRGLISTTDVDFAERITRKLAAKRRGKLLSFRLDVVALEDAPGVFIEECFG